VVSGFWFNLWISFALRVEAFKSHNSSTDYADYTEIRERPKTGNHKPETKPETNTAREL
jgi:hypothetical protein